jgi:hypothetical protein
MARRYCAITRMLWYKTSSTSPQASSERDEAHVAVLRDGRALVRV